MFPTLAPLGGPPGGCPEGGGAGGATPILVLAQDVALAPTLSSRKFTEIYGNLRLRLGGPWAPQGAPKAPPWSSLGPQKTCFGCGLGLEPACRANFGTPPFWQPGPPLGPPKAPPPGPPSHEVVTQFPLKKGCGGVRGSKVAFGGSLIPWGGSTVTMLPILSSCGHICCSHGHIVPLILHHHKHQRFTCSWNKKVGLTSHPSSLTPWNVSLRMGSCGCQ